MDSVGLIIMVNPLLRKDEVYITRSMINFTTKVCHNLSIAAVLIM